MSRPDASLLFLALALASACSRSPQPVTPSSPPAAATPAPPAAATAAPLATPPGSTEPVRDGRVVVVDPGDDAASQPKTLAEAARAERERRSHAGEPIAVITHKSLPHSKGQLTYAKPAARTSASAKPGSAKGGDKEDGRGEAYWRQRGLEIRKRWQGAAEEIHLLEQEVADWRHRFYSTDDPVLRDSQVKGEWDRALDRLRHKRDEVTTTQHELEIFLEDGRKAGALPGWLREGAELEPAPAVPSPAPTDAIEPPQLTEGPP